MKKNKKEKDAGEQKQGGPGPQKVTAATIKARANACLKRLLAEFDETLMPENPQAEEVPRLSHTCRCATLTHAG